MSRSGIFIKENKENDILGKITSYIQGKRLKVENPNYNITRKYSPQWSVLGNVYYYRTPKTDGNKIIAIISTHKNINGRPNGITTGLIIAASCAAKRIATMIGGENV